MNKSTFKLSLLIIALLAGTYSFAQRAEAVVDSLSLTPSYAQDLYYSFENGEVASVERTNWDIAFYTPRFSAGIMTNDGSTVELYTYPNGDTAAWSTVDTTGMASWTPLYNSTDNWEDGAFNMNAKGHPDYGWGWYNMSDHSVYGDSLYVINLQGEGYKKLWIIKKLSIDNIYTFKFADLDGSNEIEVELDVKPYEGKNFVYYSLTNNMELDREPEGQSWDIMFTKYIAQVDNGMGGTSPYAVTGVLSNIDIAANHFYPVPLDSANWFSKPFDTIKDKIGFDWKEFSMADFSWVTLDSNYYFVQNYAGDIYRLNFIWWDGSMSGDFALEKELVSLVSVEETIVKENEFRVYPNPATTNFTLQSSNELTGDCHVTIYDQSGRMISQVNATASELENGMKFNEPSLTKGLYIISITGENVSVNQKLLVK